MAPETKRPRAKLVNTFAQHVTQKTSRGVQSSTREGQGTDLHTESKKSQRARGKWGFMEHKIGRNPLFRVRVALLECFVFWYLPQQHALSHWRLREKVGEGVVTRCAERPGKGVSA